MDRSFDNLMLNYQGGARVLSRLARADKSVAPLVLVYGAGGATDELPSGRPDAFISASAFLSNITMTLLVLRWSRSAKSLISPSNSFGSTSWKRSCAAVS